MKTYWLIDKTYGRLKRFNISSAEFFARKLKNYKKKNKLFNNLDIVKLDKNYKIKEVL